MMQSPSAEKLSAASALFAPGDYWANLLEFPDYLISATGDVISLVGLKPRKLSPKSGPYKRYEMTRYDGKRVERYGHRLVAEMIYGPCPAGKECRHLDDDKGNCDFTNLRWGTRAENMNDRFRRDPLSDASITAMLAMRDAGLTFSVIARAFNVSQSLVRQIITTRRSTQ